MKEALDTIKQSYTGSTGGRFILDFQQQDGKAAQVTNISANDWDKKYELTTEYIKKDIIQGHQITSPVLFGVPSDGGWGASNELETAYEIFQNTYARNKRNELVVAFNRLFADSKLIEGELEFIQKALFSAKVSETLKEKIYTINELRKEAGLDPLPDGDKLLSNTPATTASPKFSTEKLSSDVFQLSEEDFDKIKDMGTITDEFDFIEKGEFIKTKEDFSKVELHFETLDEVGKYILDNEISSVKDLKVGIRKDLGINASISELKDMLAQLTKSGVINVEIDKDGKVKNIPVQNPSKKIEVLYSYDVRPGYGKPIIDSTRPFCRRLIENNRFYKREEIQMMADIFGYDIYELGGGYYRDPITGDVSTHCRHRFVSVSVSRKNKK